MAECRTCQLVARRDVGAAPLWDRIVRSRWWDVVHCYDTSVKGWIVLVARRHLATIAELTDEEASVLGPMIRDVSRALHGILDCEKTYVVQFAENRFHRHVHIHVVPKDPRLPRERWGPGIFQLLGVQDDQRVREHEMNDLAEQLRPRLLAYATGELPAKT